MCAQQQYRDASQRATNDFRNQILNYKQEVLHSAAGVPISNQPSLQQDVLRKVNELVEAALPPMMELIQLESGRYSLLLQVAYRNPKSRTRPKHTRTAQSTIIFTIGPEVRDLFRVNLRQTLLLTATNLILDPQTFIQLSGIRASGSHGGLAGY